VGRDLSRRASLLWIAVGYLLACGLGVVVLGWLEGPIWNRLLWADVAATGLVFAFSMAMDNSSVYDPYWSVAPPLFALAFCLDVGGWSARQVVLLTLLTLWGVRLTWNWASAWRGMRHEDWRYVAFRQRFPRSYWLVSALGIHLFPTLMVALASSSMIPALTVLERDWSMLDLLATLVLAGALVLEATADLQMRAGLRQSKPGEVCRKGLWSYSRHPNYVGEMGIWWGLWLFAVSADPSWWWTLFGPMAMTAMFLFISIPMLEKRQLQRRPEYARYQREVGMLFGRRSLAPSSH
jgi:steroid 5-alpha reductase family enzyme